MHSNVYIYIFLEKIMKIKIVSDNSSDICNTLIDL
jgi:hypothetical protein